MNLAATSPAGGLPAGSVPTTNQMGAYHALPDVMVTVSAIETAEYASAY